MQRRKENIRNKVRVRKQGRKLKQKANMHVTKEMCSEL